MLVSWKRVDDSEEGRGVGVELAPRSPFGAWNAGVVHGCVVIILVCPKCLPEILDNSIFWDLAVSPHVKRTIFRKE